MTSLRDRRRLLVPAGATLAIVGFTLAFGRRDSMWNDETFSAWMADQPFGGLVDRLVHVEPNMAPYYAALWFWARVSHGDLWLRSFSAVGTIATIWAVWVVARRWSGTLAAALAVGVLTLSPFVLGWSIQARGYTWAMAGTAWSIVLVDRLLDRPTRVLAAALGTIVGLTVAVQFAAAFPLLGAGIVVIAIAHRRHVLGSIALAGVVAALVFLPFGLVGLAHPDHLHWLPDLTIGRLQRELGVLGNGPLWMITVSIGIILAMLAIRRGTTDPRVAIAIAGALVGIVAIIAVSALVQPMYKSRYFAPCIPLAIIGASAGWASLTARTTRRSTASAIVATVVAAIALFTLVISFDATHTANREGNREAAAFLRENWVKDDSIVANASYEARSINRYWPRAMTGYSLVDLEGADLTLGGGLHSPSGRSIDPPRLWVVRLDGAKPLATYRKQFDALLARYPNVVETESFGSVTVELRTR